MKALVVSDSHGSTANFSRALEREKDCPFVLFLGDGADDFAAGRRDALLELPRKDCRRELPLRGHGRRRDQRPFDVPPGRGDNDYFSTLEEFAYKYIEGNTLILCHGHTVGVKRSLYPLLEKAQGVRANVALYGHTHRSDVFYDSYAGIYAINPGALFNGNYAVLTLSKNGVDVEFKNVFEVKD